MPSFATPEPINATIKLVAGDLRIVAGDRAETTVEVRPRNAASTADVKAAEETTVDFSRGALLVKAPKSFSLFGRTGSIEVTVELPAGSAVSCDSATGDVSAQGRLGACRFKTAHGDILLDRTAALEAETTTGEIVVGRVEGTARIGGCGSVRIDATDGPAHVKNIAGDTWIGTSAAEVQVNAASGDIVVEHAEQDVTARTASGDVRLRDVVRGRVVLETATGELEIGVREGTAAWLDASAMTGSVRNAMSHTDTPSATEEKVEVRARTFTGDIIVHRSQVGSK